VWDLKTGAETARLEGHVGWLRALAVLPDGRLASGGEDNTIRLWEIKTAKEIVRLEVDAGVVCFAALGGCRLAAENALADLVHMGPQPALPTMSSVKFIDADDHDGPGVRLRAGKGKR